MKKSVDKISIGQDGEALAAKFLRDQGFKILETNFKCRFGEVDIIATEGETLVFVEVKTRSSRIFGLPQEAVGRRKIEHITNVLSYYRSIKKGLPKGDRIDVVAIENGGETSVELIRNITG